MELKGERNNARDHLARGYLIKLLNYGILSRWRKEETFEFVTSIFLPPHFHTIKKIRNDGNDFICEDKNKKKYREKPHKSLKLDFFIQQIWNFPLPSTLLNWGIPHDDENEMKWKLSLSLFSSFLLFSLII